MLRRSKEDTINGIRILDLPLKTITIVKCDFSKQERRFYGSLEDNMAAVMARIQKTGDSGAYIHMLTMLLRLRQGKWLWFAYLQLCVDRENLACDHPSLVNGDWKEDEDVVINQLESPTQDDDDDDGKGLANALNNLNIGAASKCQLCFTK